ncbi:MAG: universal stress protein [Deltaproteobacteria bacterium]|nr:universal stress protein [Deltaproteobacteria bacterium]
MTGERILLPYNFTNGDQKALDFVVRMFAHLEDVSITLFYAYTPMPNIRMNDNTVMDKLKENLNYLSQKIKEQEVGLSAAKQNLIENGFSEDRIHYIFKPRKKDVAVEIIDLASSGNHDMIVMNRKPGKATRFFTGSVFNKVVSSLKNKTVCLVT